MRLTRGELVPGAPSDLNRRYVLSVYVRSKSEFAQGVSFEFGLLNRAVELSEQPTAEWRHRQI